MSQKLNSSSPSWDIINQQNWDAFIKAFKFAVTQQPKEFFLSKKDKTIAPKPYQKKIVEKNIQLFQQQRVVCNEVGCGLGKTIISALTVQGLQPKGKILFVSPSPTAMGDYSHGNISAFKTIFGEDKVALVNELYLSKNFYFLTPFKLVSIYNGNRDFAESFFREIGFIIIDEVHRFPEDTEEETVLIGKVKECVDKYCQHAKILTMTATHLRTDEMLPFGESEPHSVYTIGNGVSDGFVPEIYGLPMYIDIDVEHAKTVGEDIRVVFSKKNLDIYEKQIVDNIEKLTKEFPGEPHCFFVRTIEEAKRLQQKMNSRLGWNAFSLLTNKDVNIHGEQKQINLKERFKIIQDIEEGKSLGYITVNIGAESVDIPRLSFCHIIVRTTSRIRLAQMIGRITRNHPEKKKAVVVDYFILKSKIVKNSLGLWDYAKDNGGCVGLKKFHIAGSLFGSESEYKNLFLTYKGMEEYVTANSLSDIQERIEKIKNYITTSNDVEIPWEPNKIWRKGKTKDKPQKNQSVSKEERSWNKFIEHMLNNPRCSFYSPEMKLLILKHQPHWLKDGRFSLQLKELEKYYQLHGFYPEKKERIYAFWLKNKDREEFIELAQKYNVQSRTDVEYTQKLKELKNFMQTQNSVPGKQFKTLHHFYYAHRDKKEIIELTKTFVQPLNDRIMIKIENFFKKDGRLPNLREKGANWTIFYKKNKNNPIFINLLKKYNLLDKFQEKIKLLEEKPNTYEKKILELKKFLAKHKRLPRTTDKKEQRLAYFLKYRYEKDKELASLLESFGITSVNGIQFYIDRRIAEVKTFIESFYNKRKKATSAQCLQSLKTKKPGLFESFKRYIRKGTPEAIKLAQKYGFSESDFFTFSLKLEELESFLKIHKRMPHSANPKESSLFYFIHSNKTMDGFTVERKQEEVKRLQELLKKYGCLTKAEQMEEDIKEFRSWVLKHKRLPQKKDSDKFWTMRKSIFYRKKHLLEEIMEEAKLKNNKKAA